MMNSFNLIIPKWDFLYLLELIWRSFRCKWNVGSMLQHIGAKTEQNFLVMDFHILSLSSKVAWLDQLYWYILMPNFLFQLDNSGFK